jgi:hypothetical protein
VENSVIETTYGFEWGNVSIERVCSHKGHRVIAIFTPRGRRLIRITPSGLIRIHNPYKQEEA